MKNNLIGETIISLGLIVLLIFFMNPLDLLMPQRMHQLMVPLLVILFILFAAVLWKENLGDEREQLHKFIASRFAYVAGIAILILGIIFESIHTFIDPWLIIAICIMLLAKICGLVYGYLRR